MGFTVGIDLGTTNSVVSIKKLGLATIHNAEDEELTPSCVTCLKTNDEPEFIVGRPSINLSKQYPEETVKSVKRLMGRDFHDLEVQYIIKNNVVSYKIVTDPKEPDSIRIALLDNLYTPEAISAVILKKLINDSKLDLGGEIEQAIVTVPAYFSDRQKFATRAACQQAGLKLLRLLSEPTAAALSFGLENINSQDFKTIMVFDLGGGTFDISVLSLAGGGFMEITKGGDMWLGGDNIDQMLVDHVLKQVEKTLNGTSINNLIDKLSYVDRLCFFIEIKEKAEKLKIALSTRDHATIEVFGILKDERDQLLDIDVTITQDEFNTIIKPVIKKISTIAKQILQEIHFEFELIDTVLMVGGSSLILAIQDELKELFGANKIMVHPRPMLAVAEGAAIMASQLSEKDLSYEDFSITHVAAHDYYLQLAQGKRNLLVARNTPLPVQVNEKLKFVNSNQLIARLRVLNEIDLILEPVGEIWFHKLFDEINLDPEINQNFENLSLDFMVDEDNIITMKVGSLHDDNRNVEAQIARGGLSIKLYNDLERTLSTLIAKSKTIVMEMDLLLLSNKIVETILGVCDPVSGKIDIDKKEKAERQINLLTLFNKNNIMPISLYETVKQIKATGSKYNVLSSNDKLKLQNLITDFKIALDHLEDLNEFKKLKRKVDDLNSDFSVVMDLIMADKGAEIIDRREPVKAKEIINHAKNLAKYYLQKNYALVEQTRMKIYQEVDSRIVYNDSPTRRFDRDVTL